MAGSEVNDRLAISKIALCSLFYSPPGSVRRLGWFNMTMATPTCPNVSIQAAPVQPQIRPSLAIIGLGRVGSVLGRALHASGYPINAVSSRDPDKAHTVANMLRSQACTAAEAAQSAELTLLTISDDAIETVTRELAAAGAWRKDHYVIHASGASPASALMAAAEYGSQIGSFHPLAAFASRDAELPAGVTFGIEASEPLRSILHDMAHAVGGYPLDLSAEQKTLYHAAAVLSSNYTVTLAALATRIFEQLGTTPEEGLRALLPLMRTTLDNLERLGLPDALTGPLVRGDVGTVRHHLQALDRPTPRVAAAYRCLAHATLPLAQQRGLDPAVAGAIRDLITLPSELISD
jgi:predicted short-subunit dehydrogenase-like oxidoreductase (DUF2520 family)